MARGRKELLLKMEIASLLLVVAGDSLMLGVNGGGGGEKEGWRKEIAQFRRGLTSRQKPYCRAKKNFSFHLCATPLHNPSPFSSNYLFFSLSLSSLLLSSSSSSCLSSSPPLLHTGRLFEAKASSSPSPTPLVPKGCPVSKSQEGKGGGGRRREEEEEGERVQLSCKRIKWT